MAVWPLAGQPEYTHALKSSENLVEDPSMVALRSILIPSPSGGNGVCGAPCRGAWPRAPTSAPSSPSSFWLVSVRVGFVSSSEQALLVPEDSDPRMGHRCFYRPRSAPAVRRSASAPGLGLGCASGSGLPGSGGEEGHGLPMTSLLGGAPQAVSHRELMARRARAAPDFTEGRDSFLYTRGVGGGARH